MDVIQTGTNIATVKISELPKSTETAGRATLATNEQTNQSEALELTKVAEATQTALDAAQTANQSSQTALASAATANQAAQNADTARENIAGDLAQKSSMFTGAIMGKGGYYKADSTLFNRNSFTIRAVIGITKNLSDISAAEYVVGTGGSESVSLMGNNYIRISDGSGSRDRPINDNKLLEIIIVSNGEQSYFFLNSIKNTPGNKPSSYTAPKGIAFGRYYSSGLQFTRGNCIALQIFNFPFSDEDAAASWNGGHPELWRAPDAWRNTTVTWPTGIYQPAKSTWCKTSEDVNQTDDVPAANGFSGEFQQFISSTPFAYTAAYCQFSSRSVGNDTALFIEFEYRSYGPVYLYDDLSGYSGFKTLPANTGAAQKAYVITRAGLTCSIRTDPAKMLEIRTLSIQSAGVIVDLIPASLTPTVWKDISGQGNDIPYVPIGSNPAECEMAYENMGFPDTIIGTEAPAVIPNFIGQRYIDTTNKAEYTAYGTSSASDWK